MKKLILLFKNDKFQIVALSLIVLFILYILDLTIFRYIVVFLIYISIPTILLVWFIEKKNIKFNLGLIPLLLFPAFANYLSSYYVLSTDADAYFIRGSCESVGETSAYFSFFVVPYFIIIISLLFSYSYNKQEFSKARLQNFIVCICIFVICVSLYSLYSFFNDCNYIQKNGFEQFNNLSVTARITSQELLTTFISNRH